MKKTVLLISTVCLALSLTACNGNAGKEKDNVSNQSIQERNIEEESKSNEEKEPSIDDTDIENKVETEENTTVVSEETTEDTIIDGIDHDNPPINWGTPDRPGIAAENYYAHTVFELVSLDVLQSSKEYVKFSVVSKKGGKLVDPNRFIELRYEDGAWNVVGEGY